MVGFQQVRQGLSPQANALKGGYFLSILIGMILIFFGAISLLSTYSDSQTFQFVLMAFFVIIAFLDYTRVKRIRSRFVDPNAIDPGTGRPYAPKIPYFRIMIFIVLAAIFAFYSSIPGVSSLFSYLTSGDGSLVYYIVLGSLGVIMLFAVSGFMRKFLGVFLVLIGFGNVDFIYPILAVLPLIGPYIGDTLVRFAFGTILHSIFVFLIGLFSFLSKTQVGQTNVSY